MTADRKNRGYFSYERLDVYRVGRELHARVLVAANRLPSTEIDLRGQWLRSMNGVNSNIAEAAQELKPLEKARIYRIARREIGELNSCTADAHAAGLLTDQEFEQMTSLANRISAMLYRLIQRFSQ